MSNNRHEVRAEITEFGFNYGAAEVKRMFRDHKKGTCLIGIDTPRATIQIYVTRTGKVRVFDMHKEWKPTP